MALDYLAYQQSVKSPLEMAAAGYQTGLQMRQQQDARALAEQKRTQAAAMQADLAGLAAIDKPTTQDYTSIMLKHPALADSLKLPFEQLSKEQQDSERRTALNIYSALDSGTPEIANEILQRNIDAATNSGDQKRADSFKILQQQLSIDPKAAKSTAGLFLMSALGPEKFGENMAKLQSTERESALLPGKIKQQAAELGLTAAQTNKEIISAKKIRADIAKTNKDADSVTWDIKKKQLELKKQMQDGGVDLSTDAEKLINGSVQKQVNLNSLANQYESLSNQITSELSSGATAQAAETWKKFWGDENEITRVRQEYKRLRNSQVLQSLPPGVASDKDIEIAMGAFPGETSSPEVVASFLKGMSKLNKYEAQQEGTKAEWVSQVGSLKPTTKDLMISGVEIPKGTTFNDAVDKLFVAPSMFEEDVETAPSANLTPEQLMQEADKILMGGQ